MANNLVLKGHNCATQCALRQKLRPLRHTQLNRAPLNHAPPLTRQYTGSCATWHSTK